MEPIDLPSVLGQRPMAPRLQVWLSYRMTHGSASLSGMAGSYPPEGRLSCVLGTRW